MLVLIHIFLRVHNSLKTEICSRPFSSYRASFLVPSDEWKTIRIPFEKFKGHGPGAVDHPFDYAHLTRAGIVAIGKEMENVCLGVSGFRFYKEKA